MRKYPEIRFANGWLLEPTYRRAWNALRFKGKVPFPDYREVTRKRRAYEKAWRTVEKKILKGMCDVLDLQFRQNTVDVYVVGFARPISNPLVLSSRYSPQQAVHILTHELLHRLLTDNTSGGYPRQAWNAAFVDEPITVRNHVMVHAAHKHVYLNVLKEPKLIDAEMRRLRKYHAKDYLRSWQIVEERGYQELIKEFKGYIKAGGPKMEI
jgi:hypothetical protein